MAGSFAKLGAGDYNDYLILQTPEIQTSGTSGQRKIVWTDEQAGDGLWCAVKELSAMEKIVLGLSVEDQSLTIRVHEHPDITTQDRLIDQKRKCIYTLQSIVWAETEWIITAKRSQGIR